jgi:hypothetical protein
MIGVLSGGMLPGEWGVRDDGSTGLAGSTALGQGGIFELRGEGAGIGKRADSFHYVWQRMPYQGQILARLGSVSDADGQGMAGLMIRERLEPETRYRFIGVSADGKSEFLAKQSSDEDAHVMAGPRVKFPCWLKLVKFGDMVTAAVSSDGTTPAKQARFQFVGQMSIEGLERSYVGLVVASRKGNELATARFDHVWLQRNGLKGEFFADPEKTDLRAVRLDPKIDFQWGDGAPEPTLPASDFTARWTARLAPPSSDAYNFRLFTPDPAQLYINGQKICDTASRVQLPNGAKLQAEREYDVRIDYHRRTPGGMLQLQWQIGSQGEWQTVPSEAFIYRQDADEVAEANRAATPMHRFVPLARGAMLVDGTFLPGTPTAFDGSKVSFRYRDRKEMALPADQVARLTFLPLANFAANRMADKGAGLLTQQGDFIEGQCRSLDAKELKLDSVVFGVSTFDVQAQAAAVVLHPPVVAKTGWLVHTTSGAVLRGTGLKAKPEALVVETPVAGDLTVPWNELIDVTAADLLR